MDISVAEFADQRGVSQRRVLELIRKGDVRARRSGGRWLIDVQEINKRKQLRRPMNPEMAHALIALLSNESWQEDADPMQKHRLKLHLAELQNHKYPSWLLSSWLRKRGEVISFKANLADLGKLQLDDRIYLSGVNDPRGGISASDFVEGYIEKKYLKEFQKDYLLVDSDAPNVILRMVNFVLERPLPVGLVMADLADHNGPREDSQVARLLKAL
jgi:excisionase family DNA binding protein